MRRVYFPDMNRSLDYELQTRPSVSQTGEKPAHTVALACLLLVWAVFGATAVIFVVALLFPGHLGLSHLLQALGNLFSAGAPMYTT
jgi:hypothetical protein